MGQAKQRGTREERIAQSQAVAAMRRDEAAALAASTAEADAHHAAQLRIKQLDREERLRQLRADRSPGAAWSRRARADAVSMLAFAAAISASSFSPKALPRQG